MPKVVFSPTVSFSFLAQAVSSQHGDPSLRALSPSQPFHSSQFFLYSQIAPALEAVPQHGAPPQGTQRPSLYSSLQLAPPYYRVPFPSILGGLPSSYVYPGPYLPHSQTALLQLGGPFLQQPASFRSQAPSPVQQAAAPPSQSAPPLPVLPAASAATSFSLAAPPIPTVARSHTRLSVSSMQPGPVASQASVSQYIPFFPLTRFSSPQLLSHSPPVSHQGVPILLETAPSSEALPFCSGAAAPLPSSVSPPQDANRLSPCSVASSKVSALFSGTSSSHSLDAEAVFLSPSDADATPAPSSDSEAAEAAIFSGGETTFSSPSDAAVPPSPSAAALLSLTEAEFTLSPLPAVASPFPLVIPSPLATTPPALPMVVFSPSNPAAPPSNPAALSPHAGSPPSLSTDPSSSTTALPSPGVVPGTLGHGLVTSNEPPLPEAPEPLSSAPPFEVPEAIYTSSLESGHHSLRVEDLLATLDSESSQRQAGEEAVSEVRSSVGFDCGSSVSSQLVQARDGIWRKPGRFGRFFVPARLVSFVFRFNSSS